MKGSERAQNGKYMDEIDDKFRGINSELRACRQNAIPREWKGFLFRCATNLGRAGGASLLGHVGDDVEVVDVVDDRFADDTESRSSCGSGWPRREKRPKAASTPSKPWVMQHKQSTRSFF